MRSKLAVVTLLVGLLGAACGGAQQSLQPTHLTSSGQPIGSGQPSATPAPGATDGQASSDPQATGQLPTADDPLAALTAEDLNPPQLPLPEPAFDNVDEIVEAMFVEGLEEQAIVSMLNVLGLGLYHEDGTAIRTGTEASDNDFYLFEPEAYGLVNKLKAQSDGETWIDFSDFHAALVDFGLEATPEELLQAYADAYAEFPDEPMTRFVQAQAFLDVEAQIPPLGAWLLFVDGMIPPHGGNPPTAFVGGSALRVAAPPAGGIGVAFRNVQRLVRQGQLDQADAARLIAVLDSATLTLDVQPPPPKVHEGHGGLGAPATIIATVRPYAPTSPFSGLVMSFGPAISPDNIGVTWQYDPVVTEHGMASIVSGASNRTDARGDAKLTYTPRKEKMDDYTRGHMVRKYTTITASASKAELVDRLFPSLTAGAIVRLIRGNTALSRGVQFEISWHEPDVLRITLTNEFEITFVGQVSGGVTTKGTDTYDGVLVEQADGTWTGAVFATAKGNTGDGYFFGYDRHCAPEWNAWQVLEVFGENRPGRVPGDAVGTNSGNFVMDFYPVTPARAAYGFTLCAAGYRPGSRFKYAPFNDSRVWEPDVGLAIVRPREPTGPGGNRVTNTSYYETTGPANVLVASYWYVRIEYPEPPPP